MKNRLIIVVVSLLIALLIYSLFAAFADWRETIAVVKQLGLQVWVPLLLLSLGNYFLRFVRWVYYLKKLDKFSLPGYWRHWLIYLSGFALTTTPGKAGEGLRSFYLKPYGLSFMQSLAALFTERLTDLLSIILLSLLIVWQFPEYQLPAVLVSVLLIVMIVLLGSGKMQQLLMFVKSKLHGKLASLLQHLIGLFENSSRLITPLMLGKGVALGVVAWLLEGYGFYYLLNYMQLDIPLLLAVAIYSTAVLVGAISFLPGGLGGTEVVMVVLLVAFGVDETQAVAATLVCRVATLWFAVVLGVLALMILLPQGFPDWEEQTMDEV